MTVTVGHLKMKAQAQCDLRKVKIRSIAVACIHRIRRLEAIGAEMDQARNIDRKASRRRFDARFGRARRLRSGQREDQSQADKCPKPSHVASLTRLR